MFEHQPDWPLGHPPPRDLARTPLGAQVGDHIRGCAQCRTTRLILLDDCGPEATTVGFGSQNLATKTTQGLSNPPFTAATLARRKKSPEESLQTMLTWSSLSRPMAPVVSSGRLTLSEALGQQPNQLLRWVRQLVSALARVHHDGNAVGGLSVEPEVNANGRAILSVPTSEEEALISQDWRQLGQWIQRWLQLAPSHLLATFADELVSGECKEHVPLRLMELVDRHVDTDHLDDLGVLGRGGQGVVSRVKDRRLHRLVALKTTHHGAYAARRRFLHEAEITAQLQHPGIVPVHQLGNLPDGRPFYTMQIMRGRTLGEVMRSVHDSNTTAWGVGEDGWSLKRLIAALVSVCDTVAYAHSKGVLHRDLKPENIMLGDFGELRVLDWGLAGAEREEGEEVKSESRGTRVGDVFGTPWYMSPEQARGELASLGPFADVYALGSILFEVLSSRPPFYDQSANNTVRLLAQGVTPRFESTRPVPGRLIELMNRCLLLNPEERPTASQISTALRGWLDGVDARARADRSIEEVAGLYDEAAKKRQQAASLRASSRKQLQGFASFTPAEQRFAAWAQEDEADALQVAAAVLEARIEQGLRAALHHVPGHEVALEQIATLYKNRLVDAERKGRNAETARIETLLHDHADGHYRKWLRGDGRLTLITDPPGATVLVARFEERNRQLVAIPEGCIGTTPLVNVPLEKGSYQLTIRHEGCVDVVYPVLIEREQHWSGVAPGDTEPTAIWLPKEGQLAADDCYVPAGWFKAGGDVKAVDTLSARRLWCDGLVMKQNPVSIKDYFSFLNALLERGESLLDVLELAPRVTSPNQGELSSLYRLQDGRLVAKYDDIHKQAHGSLPVVGVYSRAADAYCAFRGEGWRLPHDLEWEKAARGVDGRLFVTGRQLNPTWTRMVASQSERPSIVRPSTLTSDVSVYGIRGLMGNVRDICCNSYERGGPKERVVVSSGLPHEPRMIRGGSWVSQYDFCRPATRLVIGESNRRTGVGFRMARSV